MARLRRWVEDTLPWYSPEDERRHRAYTADLERRGEEAVSIAKQIRIDYAAYGNRVERVTRVTRR